MTDRKQALTELLGAVEAGAEISDGYNHHLLYVCFPAIQLAGTDNPRFNESVNSAVNAYNGSLDAAKALFEAVLPSADRGLAVYMNNDDDPVIWYVNFYMDAELISEGEHKCPARAWLIAILIALISGEDAQ